MNDVMSSRLKPKVIWVRSLVPNEKNSASSAILSAVRAARGTSIMVPIRYSTLVPALAMHLVGHGDGPLLEEDELLDGADQRDHDLGEDLVALLLDLDGGLDDRADLHVADLGELDRQAAAAEAEHRVGLVELLDPALDLLDGDAELPGDLGLAGLVVRQELVRGAGRAGGWSPGRPAIASKMPTKSSRW